MPDVTKGTPNNKDQAVQAAVPQMDACTQTEETSEMFAQCRGDPNYVQGLTAIAHYAEHSNQPLPFTNNLGFVRPEAMVPGVHVPVVAHQSEAVVSSSYLVPDNHNPGTFSQFGSQYQINHAHPPSHPAMFAIPAPGPNALNGVSPRPDSVGHEKKQVSALNIMAPGAKGEIVDECEDLAIQQSMDEFEEFERELERKQTSSSYATAVKEHESHARGLYSFK